MIIYFEIISMGECNTVCVVILVVSQKTTMGVVTTPQSMNVAVVFEIA